jgi:long-chain acyl-CoA synthetase
VSTQVQGRVQAANPADLPTGTLVQLFFEGAERNRADALRHKRDGRWVSISHTELVEDVRRLTLALGALGLNRGDRIAILSENRPEWAMADYATLCFGGLDVPIYSTLPPDQIAYILKDSGARAIFLSSEEQLAKVRQIRHELPDLEKVIVFDAPGTESEDVLTLRDALDLGRREAEAGKGDDFRARALVAAAPEDVATVLYTSGTTGPPKGVMLTHDNIFSNAQAVSRILDVTEDDVALSLLPLSHIFERMVDYFLFWKGVTIAYAESIEKVADNLGEVRPTIVASTPRMYEKIYARVMSATGVKRKLVLWAKRVGEARVRALVDEGRPPGILTRFQFGLADRLVFEKLRQRTGGRLRFFVSGGAPLSEEIARFFYAAGILIVEGYGLTETSPVTNVNTEEAFRFGTVGKPVPGTEIRIAEDGEVLVRGRQVMKGYYNQPEATREVLDADGWFRTGDIGELDEDGFLRITDRKKDIIVTAGGKNIAPQPIENLVKTNRFVAEAVMVGDRRPYPVLLVTPAADALEAWAREQGIDAAGPADLLKDERVRGKLESEVLGLVAGLARFEQPKKIGLLGEEFTVESGELTPTLKVKRRVVEERYADVIESLYRESAGVPVE